MNNKILERHIAIDTDRELFISCVLNNNKIKDAQIEGKIIDRERLKRIDSFFKNSLYLDKLYEKGLVTKQEIKFRTNDMYKKGVFVMGYQDGSRILKIMNIKNENIVMPVNIKIEELVRIAIEGYYFNELP